MEEFVNIVFRDAVDLLLSRWDLERPRLRVQRSASSTTRSIDSGYASRIHQDTSSKQNQYNITTQTPSDSADRIPSFVTHDLSFTDFPTIFSQNPTSGYQATPLRRPYVSEETLIEPVERITFTPNIYLPTTSSRGPDSLPGLREEEFSFL
jgi:hypothetical protein